jgi:hypothetical protein
MNDDPEVSLRDHFATAIIQALLTSQKQFTYLNQTGTINGNLNGSDAYSNVSLNASLSGSEFQSEDKQTYIQRLEKDLELFTDFAYKVADQMRVSRLKTFK